MANKRITDVDYINSLNGDESFFVNQNNTIKQVNKSDIVFDISNGGTGATTAEEARSNLGITLANLGVTATADELNKTAAELNKLDGLTATATELNYCDGVTSNIQTQLNGKAASSHNHAASNITSGTLSADRLPTVPITKGGTGATTAEAALANLGAVPTSTGVQTYSRSVIGDSPNFNDPEVNGLFELRNATETTEATGTRPYNGYGAFLSLKTSDNLAMMQLAGGTEYGYYIRAKQKQKVTMDNVAWSRILTNVLTSNDYGTSLPAAGTAGRIFFKKASG